MSMGNVCLGDDLGCAVQLEGRFRQLGVLIFSHMRIDPACSLMFSSSKVYVRTTECTA